MKLSATLSARIPALRFCDGIILFALALGLTAAEPARHHGQRLDVSFAPSETRLQLPFESARNATSLKLLGYGYGDRLLTPEPAQLRSTGNRTEYRRGALTEWYVNDARGLEQGFTLNTRPVPAPGKGPLVIALAVSGGLHPELNSPADVSLLDSSGLAVLRYSDLRSWDAERRPLPARLKVDGRQIRLMVDDSRATYPITIDPLVSPIIFIASDGSSADHFGTSIAVDGNIAVVGAPGHGGGQGEAVVFARSGNTWTQQAVLLASDRARGDQFGVSVSVSGTTAVVGASGRASGQGAAYVFVQSGTTWTQQAELTSSDAAAGDAFGAAVSLSGTTAVIGASSKGSGRGAAYVFAGSGGVWTQQAALSSTDGAAGDAFGFSVSVNGDTAVVGAYAKSNNQGAAYVFVRSAGAWSQQAKLAAIALASDAEFGYSVSVNADTAVVGTRSASFATGNAYVFVRTGTTWNQQAHLTSPGDSGADEFGITVAVNGDTILCAEPFNSQAFGEAYIFVRSGSTWTPQPKLTASDGANGDVFSTALALSADTVMAASPGKTSGQGEAYVFAHTGSAWTQQAILKTAGGSSSDGFGGSVAVSGDTAVIASASQASGQGAVYVFQRAGANWAQQAKLIASDAAAGDNFGTAAIDGDTALIGAPSKGNQGAAYVFIRSGGAWTQQAKLVASDAANNDFFGTSVSIQGDTAVLGANGRSSNQGVAYVFVRSGTTWTQQAKLSASDAGFQGSFGSCVSVSGDTIVVGARSKANFQGGAYVYLRSGTTWTEQSKLAPSDSATGDNFGLSCSLEGDTAIVSAYGKNGAAGAVYAFARSGTTWSQQAKLTASDGATRDIFGYSLSLNDNLALIGAYQHAGQGAAYLFARSGAAWTQQLELNAPDAASGDAFGFSVSLYKGTMLAGASGKFAQLGEAYLFPMPFVSTGGVVNGAGFQSPVAQGSLTTIFGNNFSTADTLASQVPFPQSLNGVSVSINNSPAPMQFAGYGQINFQMPYEIPTGSAAVVVTVNGVSAFPATVQVTSTAPGILVYGANHALIQNQDYSLNQAGAGAKVGTYVTVYGAGLGQLDNAIPTGAATPNDPLSRARVLPTATIGGVDAPVSFAGMAPGFVGLAQVDVQVPDLPAGTYPVVIKQGGQTSNSPVMDVTR